MSNTSYDVYKGFSREDAAVAVEEVYGGESGDRFRYCGKGSVFFACNDCGDLHSFDRTCDYRFCDRCGDKAFKTMKRYQRVTRRMDDMKLITLTIKNAEDLGEDDIRGVRSDFYELRERLEDLTADETRDIIRSADVQEKKKNRYIASLKKVLYDQRIKGGLYAIEIKNDGQGWNIHIHVLADCEYIAQPVLSSLWNDIAGAPVVDIKKADQGAVKYILKYVFKPPHVEGIEAFQTYIETVKDMRLYSTFGSLYDFKPQEREFSCPECGGTDIDWIGSTSPWEDTSLVLSDHPPPPVHPSQTRLLAAH